ncbi:lectin subunit alpha-like [Stomoxys calcitrans]|uniref:C-type lectin domain-containing protein n=1 Tax=Stomoxys calcitrans TaxID=35570 RepID=A0A1I8Q5U1_STOCA|nr:lectin subunit alpha-like [Stomoxys calcitrans]
MLAKGFVLFVALFQLASAAYWYTAGDGNHYLIEGATNYNWLQAFDQCARQGLQLAVVDNASKNSALTALLRLVFGSSPDLWIGHHDEFNTKVDKNRLWFSPFSGLPISFSNWASIQPDNNNQNEHCVQISRVMNYQWNDAFCEHKFGFICEHSPRSQISVARESTQENVNEFIEYAGSEVDKGQDPPKVLTEILKIPPMN